MAQYGYRAIDSEGISVEGVSRRGIAICRVQQLREQGHEVTFVEALHPPIGLKPLRQRLNWDDLVVFHEQLLAVMRSGLPLYRPWRR